jgi:hypothetical protein
MLLPHIIGLFLLNSTNFMLFSANYAILRLRFYVKISWCKIIEWYIKIRKTDSIEIIYNIGYSCSTPRKGKVGFFKPALLRLFLVAAVRFLILEGKSFHRYYYALLSIKFESTVEDSHLKLTHFSHRKLTHLNY